MDSESVAAFRPLPNDRPASDSRRRQRSQMQWRLLEMAIRRLWSTVGRALGCVVLILCSLCSVVWLFACWATLSQGTLPCDQPSLRYFMLVDILLYFVPLRCCAKNSRRVAYALFSLPAGWAFFGVIVTQRSQTCAKTDAALFRAVTLYIHFAATIYLLIIVILALYRFDRARRSRILGEIAMGECADEVYDGIARIIEELPKIPAGCPELIDAEDGAFMDCLICFHSFEQGDTPIVKTDCMHYWHQACLVKWCRHNDTCPLCRSTIKGLTQPSILDLIDSSNAR